MFSFKKQSNFLNANESLNSLYISNRFLIGKPSRFVVKNQGINIEKDIEKQAVLYNGYFDLVLDITGNDDVDINIGSDNIGFAEHISALYGLDNSFLGISDISRKPLIFKILLNKNNWTQNLRISVSEKNKGIIAFSDNLDDINYSDSINLFVAPMANNIAYLTPKAIFNSSGILEKIIFVKNI